MNMSLSLFAWFLGKGVEIRHYGKHLGVGSCEESPYKNLLVWKLRGLGDDFPRLIPVLFGFF